MKTEYKLIFGRKVFLGVIGLFFLFGIGRIIYNLIYLRQILVSPITSIVILTAILYTIVNLIALTFSGTVAYFSLYKLMGDRLLLAENGITYQTIGNVIYSRWSNLKHLGSSGLFGIANGIFVVPDDKEKLLGYKARWFWNKNSRGEIFIPLSFFVNNWQNSELGQKIRQHAPDLFEK